MKSNGHDTSTSRVNGHGPVPPSRAAHEDMDAPIEPGRAASDDARDIPSAADATSASAGTERDACAEAARPRGRGTRPGSNRASDSAGPGTPRAPSETHANRNTRKKKNKDKNKDKDKNKNKGNGNHGSEEDLLDIPPGSEPLPEDGLGFVDAIHEHVDLYLACARLVKAKDPKISQRMVERLLEMSYGKAPAAPEEQAPQIIFDAPRPIRD
jgi:hypothetical protein